MNMSLNRNIRPQYNGDPNIVTNSKNPYVKLAFENTRQYRRLIAKLSAMPIEKAKKALRDNKIRGKEI